MSLQSNEHIVPSRTRIVVENVRDAGIIIEAVRLGKIPEVTRAFTHQDKSKISVGDIFVWRFGTILTWEDGRQWTNYRKSGSFVYQDEANGNLVKKEYNTSTLDPGVHWFLVSYRSKSDDDNEHDCIKVLEDPVLKTIKRSLVHRPRIPQDQQTLLIPGIQLKPMPRMNLKRAMLAASVEPLVPSKRSVPIPEEPGDYHALARPQVPPPSQLTDETEVSGKAGSNKESPESSIPPLLGVEPPAKRFKYEILTQELPSSFKLNIRHRYGLPNPARRRRFPFHRTRMANILGSWLTRAFDFLFPSW